MTNSYQKNIKAEVLLQLEAGKATPAPPVGPCLGPSRINLVQFCEEFNKRTQNKTGKVEIGVIIYDDLTYEILSKRDYLEFKRNTVAEILSPIYHKWEDEIGEETRKLQ